MNKIFHADCFDILKTIPDNSVDAVITDPPYGYLKHKLDCPFDAQLLFSECFRVLKDTGFLLFFGRGVPLSKWNIICDDLGFIFKEELIWYKKNLSNPCHPVGRLHELASLFGKKKSKLNRIYIDKLEFDEAINPNGIVFDYKRILAGIKNIKSYEDFIFWTRKKINREEKHKIMGQCKKGLDVAFSTYQIHQRGCLFKSIMPVNREHYHFQHPTQKPVKLFKQLIELTTKEGDLILDPFAGSFTTSLACLELNRKYTCIEKDKEYYEVGKNRIAKWHEENNQKDLFTGN
jgi:site-specific DNA-methyltransferase (adenine-specific)